MTATADRTDSTTNGLPQERRLVTTIPGPRSQALQARKTAAVSAGVGVTLPVYVAKAGGGVLRRRRRQLRSSTWAPASPSRRSATPTRRSSPAVQKQVASSPTPASW